VLFLVNSCAKENTVINFRHILYYRVADNLVNGIFTASYAVSRPQMNGHFIGHLSVGMARCVAQWYMWQLLFAQLPKGYITAKWSLSIRLRQGRISVWVRPWLGPD